MQKPCLPSYGAYILCVRRGFSHTAFFGYQKLFVPSVSLLWTTMFYFSNSVRELHLYLSFIDIFMSNALLNLLTAFLNPLRGPSAHYILPMPTSILSKSLVQELTSSFVPSSLSLIESQTAFLCIFSYPRIEYYQEEYISRHLSNRNWPFIWLFFYSSSTFFFFVLAPEQPLLIYKISYQLFLMVSKTRRSCSEIFCLLRHFVPKSGISSGWVMLVMLISSSYTREVGYN